MQYKSQALKTYARFHGFDAFNVLKKASEYPEKSYRNAAFEASLAIPGKEIIKRLDSLFTLRQKPMHVLK